MLLQPSYGKKQTNFLANPVITVDWHHGDPPQRKSGAWDGCQRTSQTLGAEGWVAGGLWLGCTQQLQPAAYPLQLFLSNSPYRVQCEGVRTTLPSSSEFIHSNECCPFRVQPIPLFYRGWLCSKLLVNYWNQNIIFLKSKNVFVIIVDIKYYIVIRHLYDLPSDPPDQSSPHLAPYTVITMLLTIFPVPYILHAHDYSVNRQFVLLNPFAFFTCPPKPLPIWQPSVGSLFL